MAGQKNGLLRWIEARPLAVFALCFAAGTAIAHAALPELWLVWAIAAVMTAFLMQVIPSLAGITAAGF